MGFWNRKKKQPAPVEYKCNHKWRDFPWYVSAMYYEDTRKFELKIVEPYVCVHCKERKDVVLHEVTRAGYSWDDALELLEDCDKKYGEYCEPRPIVEDMIHDMQLVDRQYLEILASLHPEKLGDYLSPQDRKSLELKT